jgi:hypothetical protein
MPAELNDCIALRDVHIYRAVPGNPRLRRSGRFDCQRRCKEETLISHKRRPKDP